MKLEDLRYQIRCDTCKTKYGIQDVFSTEYINVAKYVLKSHKGKVNQKHNVYIVDTQENKV